jgi:hypothetical protein
MEVHTDPPFIAHYTNWVERNTNGYLSPTKLFEHLRNHEFVVNSDTIERVSETIKYIMWYELITSNEQYQYQITRTPNTLIVDEINILNLNRHRYYFKLEVTLDEWLDHEIWQAQIRIRKFIKEYPIN